MATSLNPATDPLLGRDAFRQAVFARSQHRCVLCSEPAVDAHHVLERKLFTDGGYYLSNGAAVCAACHLACEYTQVSVEQVRCAAGITAPRLPVGLAPQHSYDKWGNRVWPTGLRSTGALAEDVGMRRALAAGGFLGILMPADYTEA
jgi:hypothetical protein